MKAVLVSLVVTCLLLGGLLDSGTIGALGDVDNSCQIIIYPVKVIEDGCNGTLYTLACWGECRTEQTPQYVLSSDERVESKL